MSQADRILMAEAAVAPLTYGRTNGLIKPWVSRFPLSPLNRAFWKDIVIDPH